MGISVVIIAQDEERTIGDVLKAVSNLAREIILVDSGSSDSTPEIATAHGAIVVHQDWLGYAAQKNFALEKASEDWILSLDADEIITPELSSEIQSLFSAGDPAHFDGARIARLMYVGETPVRHGGFYPDAQLRLIRRGMGKFNDRLVHESIKLESDRVIDLKNHLLHKAYRDIDQFKAALDKYALLAAKEALRKPVSPWKSSAINEFFHPKWTFFYRYFMRLGFLDGELGLTMNRHYADYVKSKITHLRSQM